MQNIIFYNPIPGTTKLASILTDMDVHHFIDIGTIPSKSKYYIELYDHENLDQRAMLYHIEYLRFDNFDNPQKVVLDKDMLSIAILEDVRTKRVEQFRVLDGLQVRASMMGKQNIVDEIEHDKNILRDLPNSINFDGKNSIKELYKIDAAELFVELFVDYKEKYEPKFKK
jgi:hypothetical protein